VHAVQRAARARRGRAARRARAGPRGSVRARPRDRDRARGFDPRRLHAGRAHASRALQTHRERPLERGARRVAGGVDRSLRLAAAAAEDSVRHYLAEAASTAGRHREDPGGRRRRQLPLRRALEDRAAEAAEADRGRAETLPARRAVQAALRLAGRNTGPAAASHQEAAASPDTRGPRGGRGGVTSSARYTAGMKFSVASLATALVAAACAGPLSAQPAATPSPPIPQYQVEIIVFAHREFDAGEERYS